MKRRAWLRIWVLGAALAVAMAAPAAAHVPNLDVFLPAALEAFPPACDGLEVVQTGKVDGVEILGFAVAERCWILLPASGVHYWPPRLVCHVVFHEAGHLSGLGHSPDPADLMFATVERIHPPCVELSDRLRGRERRRGRPCGRRGGRPAACARAAGVGAAARL